MITTHIHKDENKLYFKIDYKKYGTYLCHFEISGEKYIRVFFDLHFKDTLEKVGISYDACRLHLGTLIACIIYNTTKRNPLSILSSSEPFSMVIDINLKKRSNLKTLCYLLLPIVKIQYHHTDDYKSIISCRDLEKMWEKSVKNDSHHELCKTMRLCDEYRREDDDNGFYLALTTFTLTSFLAGFCLFLINRHQ